MKSGLVSAFHFFLAIVIAFSSIFFLQAGLSPWLKVSFFSFFEKPGAFIFVGFMGVLFSLLLFVAFYYIHRKSFYRVKMQAGTLSIEEEVVKGILEAFFRKQMPEISFVISIHFYRKKKLEIVAYVPAALRSAFYIGLAKSENALGKELLDKLGYEGAWHVTAIFV